MRRYVIALGSLALFLSLGTTRANAQASDSQRFVVRVPTVLSITAPSAEVAITHDGTDNDQIFPDQQWIVRGNADAGVTVVFSTDQAFTQSGGDKRDAQLQLAVGGSQGPATWTVTAASDQTDYASGDEVATVAASSDDAGLAQLDITMIFKTVTFGTFESGDYSLTLTGTVTEN